MKYQGGKNRISKHILPIILTNRDERQWYVEPFAGGFNCIDKVSGLRTGTDINPYVVDLFKAVQSGWIPPSIVTHDEYQSCKSNIDSFPSHLAGFIGIGCSFAGKWFGGYARGNTNKGTPRNYALESKNNILKQVPSLQGVKIQDSCNYIDMDIPSNSIIYCDPPYAGTTKYKDSFDSVSFWEWVRGMETAGHSMYVSEYNAPSDFECIWSKEVVSSLDRDTGSKRASEKLFIKLT